MFFRTVKSFHCGYRLKVDIDIERSILLLSHTQVTCSYRSEPLCAVSLILNTWCLNPLWVLLNWISMCDSFILAMTVAIRPPQDMTEELNQTISLHYIIRWISMFDPETQKFWLESLCFSLITFLYTSTKTIKQMATFPIFMLTPNNKKIWGKM